MHGQAGHTRTHSQGTDRASERRRAPSAAVAGRGPKLVIESLMRVSAAWRRGARKAGRCKIVEAWGGGHARVSSIC